MAYNSNRYIPGQIPGDDSDYSRNNWFARIRRALVTETRIYSAIKTADFTCELERVYPCDTTTASFAANLPAATAATDKCYVIKKTDSTAHTVTVTAAGTDTIDGAATVVLTNQWDVVVIRSDGINQWYVEHVRLGGSGGGTAFYTGVFLTTAGSGTINVPTGCTMMEFLMTGGGGAGGGQNTNNRSGGGGGSGETIQGKLQVTSGGTVSYTVGAKGAGVSAGDGGSGTASSLVGTNGVTYSAAGGVGGTGASGGGGKGGGRAGPAGGTKATPGGAGADAVNEGLFAQSGASGGAAGSNSVATSGGNGGNAGPYTGGAGGGAGATGPGSGGGAASYWGNGAAGILPTVNANGNSATATSYGAAGGGSVTVSGSTATTGGDGAPGVIWYRFL